MITPNFKRPPMMVGRPSKVSAATVLQEAKNYASNFGVGIVKNFSEAEDRIRASYHDFYGRFPDIEWEEVSEEQIAEWNAWWEDHCYEPDWLSEPDPADVYE